MLSSKAAAPHLEIRLLGELEVLADGVKLALPQSKKTRALLGFLLLSGQEHRRDRLCSLLWDVVDDPRAALRWSLSKLRELVDNPEIKRLCSDREHVSLERTGLYVDALELPRLLGTNVHDAAPQSLAAARGLFRGELLEGIELADFHGFSAWLLAERSRFREQHRRVLHELIERSGGHPERVLPLIRDLVHIDPTDAAARAKFLEVLHATGAIGEAHEQARANQRLIAPASAVLPQHSARESAAPLMAEADHPSRSQAKPDGAGTASRDRALDDAASAEPRRHEPQGAETQHSPPLIGREHELAALHAWLDTPNAKLKAWLFEGEAGMGKSRLLREHERLAAQSGAQAVRVRVPDARPGWPYAALQALLAQLERDGKGPLEQLVQGAGSSAASTREELLQAVQGVLERAVKAHRRLVLLLDDVHYLDDASVELLHHCAINLRALPIAFVLSARGGELHDRPSLTRTLRALRREHILEELQLAPLTLAQIQLLLAPAIAGGQAQQLFEQSGGNPLFALLLREQLATEKLPRSIAQLVQDRVASLPAEQADVLRWAAVLGTVLRTDLLRQLVALDDEAFVEALEGLERHGWLSLQPDAENHARFVHQIVQRALHDHLSEPRKRLMHSKIAQLLAASSGHADTLELTALLAHHAVAGGDRALAVRACLAAGQRCVRVYAHADAYSLARRGLAQVQHLSEPDRTCLSLELFLLQLNARWPDSPDEVLPELVRLTDSALDIGAVGYAHVGFHLRAYIKWQAGDPADALRYSREVERISRMTAPRERAEALADSARCLAQLERDLSDAEAFVNEAELLADAAQPPAGLPLARGMLTLFRGDHLQAAVDLERARQLAARAGNRLEEFYSLEFCIYLELARERYPAALALCAELTSAAERLRGGSELAFARATEALVRVLAGLDHGMEQFEERYEELAAQDAKQRCAYLAAEAAHCLAARGETSAALAGAQRALELARAVDRATECALALSVIVRVERPAQPQSCAALAACLEKPVSALARSRAQQALALTADLMPQSVQEKPHGARDRRTRVRGARAS